MIAPRRPSAVSVRGALTGAAAVVLLSVAAAGAEARRFLSYRALGVAGSILAASRHASVPLAIAAAVAALAVLLSVSKRRRPAGRRGPGRRRMTRRERALTAVAALLALAAVLTARAVTSARRARPVPRPAHAQQPGGPDARSPWHLGLGAGAIVLVVAVIALAVVVLLVASRRRPVTPAPDHTAALMADAAAGGRRALLAARDPREAVLAAYLSMESHLADNGFVLSPSRTADEVLVGAAGGGYVDASAAAILVRLFERARFSRRAMTASDRDRALTALDALAARAPR